MKTLMTAEQFAELDTPEFDDFELIAGELVPVPSGTAMHSMVRDAAVEALRGYLRPNRRGRAIGEIDCLISSDTVLRPDVAVFLGSRLEPADLYRVPIPFAPDIAIEVLSPSERAIDVTRRALFYLTAGTQEVWILDHSNGEIAVRSNTGVRLLHPGDALESPLLPGFSVPVSDLLAGL